MKPRTKDTIIILIIFLAILGLGRLILPVINSPETTDFIIRMGPLGPVIIIIYVIISHVFAPITASPMLFVSAPLFGLFDSMVYFYIAGLFSSAINFWIARRFGREWVIRLVGKSSIKDIDNFVKVEGTEALIISRFFGFSAFDFISYAAGLTNIDFKKYYLITNVIAAFVSIILYQIYKNVDLRTEQGIFAWSASLILITISFTFLIRHYLHKKSMKEENTQL